MYYAVLFLIEILFLFLLSKSLTNNLFNLFYRLTKSKRISIYLMSLLFLPGTVIHELSHMFMAVILQVPVGNMELMPKLVGQDLRMGSVQIAKSDPIRRALIGMAPFLFGTAIIFGMFFYITKNNLFDNRLIVIMLAYFVFEIGNTMFSSRKDMEGALELLLVFLILFVVLYLVGFRLPSLNPNVLFSNKIIIQTFKTGSLYMAGPVMIDLALIALLKLLRL
jgi:hypothetical protein